MAGRICFCCIVIALTVGKPPSVAAGVESHPGIKRGVERIVKGLGDRSRWHRLPNNIRHIRFTWGQKPVVSMHAVGRAHQDNTIATAEAIAAWPVVPTYFGYISGSLDGRIASGLFGYYDGKAWHKPEKPLGRIGSTEVVWLAEGPVVRSNKPLSVRYFHKGEWRFHELSCRLPPDNRNMVRMQRGAGNTLTVWPLRWALPDPPDAVLHLWDGRAWHVLTSRDGLPDDPVAWAVCVGPGKLWVLSQRGYVHFVDLALRGRDAQEALPERIRAYLAAAGAARRDLLPRIALRRRDAIKEAQAVLAKTGSVPHPSDARVRQFTRCIEEVSGEIKRLSAIDDIPSQARVVELRGEMEEWMAALAEARAAYEKARERRCRYEALLDLVKELDEAGRPRVQWKAVGLEPGGHAWVQIGWYPEASRFTGPEKLVRLGPDGRKQSVCEMKGLYEAGCAMSTKAGPFLHKPDGSGVWRWNGKKMEVLMDSLTWPREMSLVGCDEDGWLYASRPVGRYVLGWRNTNSEYWILRPDARDAREKLPVKTFPGVGDGWWLSDGRVVAPVKSARGNYLAEFRSGEWSCLDPQHTYAAARVLAGQDGAVWRLGGTYSSGPKAARVTHRGKRVMAGDVPTLVRERFADVLRLAPTRAAYVEGPIRVGKRIWFIDGKFPVVHDGDKAVSLERQLTEGLQRCKQAYLSGPMEDGKTLRLLGYSSDYRCQALLRTKEDGTVEITSLKVGRIQNRPNQRRGRCYFDGKGRILSKDFRWPSLHFYTVGLDKSVRLPSTGTPVMADPFGRLWMIQNFLGLYFTDGQEITYALPDRLHAYLPVYVPSRERAFVTNGASILELQCDAKGSWSVRRDYGGIDWPMPMRRFVGYAGGYALFHGRNAGVSVAVAVKLPLPHENSSR